MKNGDIICHEHGVQLGDDALIEAICDSFGFTRAGFDSLPEDEQHALQLDWVAPMPTDFGQAHP